MDYLLPLQDRQIIAANTVVLSFDTSGTNFTFRAGQYADFTLLRPPYRDEQGNSRTFSFANSPKKPGVEIAMRLSSSAFKRSINTIPLGTKIHVSKPMGYFTFHKDMKIAVCIAGGIGVTPFCSLIANWDYEGACYNLHLFYSNPTPDSVAFLNFFQDLESRNKLFHFIPTVTRRTSQSWSHSHERITPEFIKRFVPNYGQAIFYLAGSRDFVEAVSELLQEAGIQESRIKTEDFGDIYD